MGADQEQCVPLCAEVGHRLVTAMVVICRHHGAVHTYVKDYEENESHPLVFHTEDRSCGPFTSDIDVVDAMRIFGERVVRAMRDSRSV